MVWRGPSSDDDEDTLALEEDDGVIGRLTVPVYEPISEALAEITIIAQLRSGLDADSYRIVRLAALVAVDAPAYAYQMEFDSLDYSGRKAPLEEIQGILVTIAPIVGTPRIQSAATQIASALGVDAAFIETEQEQQDSAPPSSG